PMCQPANRQSPTAVSQSPTPNSATPPPATTTAPVRRSVAPGLLLAHVSHRHSPSSPAPHISLRICSKQKTNAWSTGCTLAPRIDEVTFKTCPLLATSGTGHGGLVNGVLAGTGAS